MYWYWLFMFCLTVIDMFLAFMCGLTAGALLGGFFNALVKKKRE